MTNISVTLNFATPADVAAFFARHGAANIDAVVGAAAPTEGASPQPETAAAPKAKAGRPSKAAPATESASSAPGAEPAAATAAPAATPATEPTAASAAPASTPTPAETPAAEAAPAEQAAACTYADVVDALMAYSKKPGVAREEFAAFLKGYGVARVPELQAKPELFADIVAAAKAKLAA